MTGHDTLAVAGTRVVLHRVTLQQPGPVDSTVTDATGRFAFRLTPDSGAIYLVSARWAGIAYFGPPLDLSRDAAPGGITVVVADTSSDAPIRLAARHLIVSSASAEGTRDVVDLFVLDNPGTVTRTSRDSLAPTWRVRLPHFAINVHGGNSGFSLESMRMFGDTIALLAAIPPGQRDLEIDYQIPPNSRDFTLPVDGDVPVSNIISDDKSLVVRGSFIRSDTTIDGKAYARWQGRLIAGEPLVLEFGGRPVPQWVVPVMIGAMALALVGVTLRTLREDR